MNTIHRMVRGNSLPHLVATLRQANAVIPDLSTATVSFVMIPVGGGAEIGGVCVVDNAETGAVHYEWKAGETDNAGSYQGRFQVLFGSLDTLDVPTVGFVSVEIYPKATD